MSSFPECFEYFDKIAIYIWIDWYKQKPNNFNGQTVVHMW